MTNNDKCIRSYIPKPVDALAALASIHAPPTQALQENLKSFEVVLSETCDRRQTAATLLWRAVGIAAWFRGMNHLR